MESFRVVGGKRKGEVIMKVYVDEDNDVFFDFQDVNFEAGQAKFTDKKFNRESWEKVKEYRDFLRECRCVWGRTFKPQVKRLYYQADKWDGLYSQAYGFLKVIEHIAATIHNLNYIELGVGFKEFVEEIRQRVEKLYQIERAKELENQRKQRWKSACKNGCGSCQNKCRSNDDYYCRATGEQLPEKNVPRIFNGAYWLFNYIPFPTENCPFNIEKDKENHYERISEACGSKKAT